MENLFQIATRENYHFPSTQGELNIQDLWQLPLTSKRGASLNDVAIRLDQEINKNTERSFVRSSNPQPGIQTLRRKLEVVTTIIGIIEEERENRKNEKARKEQEQMILSRLAEKKGEAFLNMTEQELEAELAKLRGAEQSAAE